MKAYKSFSCLLAALALGFSAGANAASFHIGDLVASPTRVNGFEGVGAEVLPVNASYTEAGIRVEQVNGDVWTGYGQTLGFPGTYSWYASNGDTGYTKITNTNGQDFSDVSIITGNGFSGDTTYTYLNYSLWDNGSEVLAGSTLQYLQFFPVSFTGGGFDTILLSATFGGAAGPLSGAFQALAIDQIKVGDALNPSPVPLPAAAPLMLSALGLLGFLTRKKAAV